MTINRLIIIGNGFDLSLGLKTSYKDFLYNYLKSIIIKIYEKEIVFGLDLNTNRYKYSDDLITLFCPTDKILFYELNKYDDYDKLSKHLMKNKFLSYDFELLENFHRNSINGNWTDIEILYYDSMVSIIKKHGGNTSNLIKREKLIRIFNDKFDKLRLELIKYLSGVKPPWVEGDNQEEYLNQIPHYTSNFFSEIFELNNNDIQVGDVMVLNFNYTNTLQFLDNYFPLNYKFKLNHIHGYIKNRDSVIFGFGDELDKDYLMLESERSSELFKYIKSPHYFQSPNYKRLNKFINNGVYEVYILGHSCGISDRTLLNEIFENEYCKSIRIFYHEREDSTNNKLDSSIEIMKHFKDKKKMREKIKTFTEDDKMFQLTL